MGARHCESAQALQLSRFCKILIVSWRQLESSARQRGSRGGGGGGMRRCLLNPTEVSLWSGPHRETLMIPGNTQRTALCSADAVLNVVRWRRWIIHTWMCSLSLSLSHELPGSLLENGLATGNVVEWGNLLSSQEAQMLTVCRQVRERELKRWSDRKHSRQTRRHII